MSIYKCYFTFRKGGYGESWHVAVSENGPTAFMDGFWVSEHMIYTTGVVNTTGMNCKYWIPPSQILYIEKTTED